MNGLITTHENGVIRRRSSPQVVWELASRQERERLTALCRPDLLAAIKANAIVDLTEADQAIVIEHLAAAGGRDDAAPLPVAAARRKPNALRGKGLSHGPRLAQRQRLVLGLAITAPIAWILVLAVGLSH